MQVQSSEARRTNRALVRHYCDIVRHLWFSAALLWCTYLHNAVLNHFVNAFIFIFIFI
jgi:hypothetical protein